MNFFPPIDPDADKVLSFDCTPQLAANEVLMGGPTVTVVCCAGEDANPEGIIAGPAAYDSTGTFILQPVDNLETLVGNDYLFEAISKTTNTFKNVVVRSVLQVRIT